MKQLKVTVRTAEYLEEKDLMVFTLTDTDSDKDQTYCWPPSDYFAAMGISPKIEYQPYHLHEHCKMMIGKKINFVIEGKMPHVNPKVDLAKKAEIEKQCAELAEQAGEKFTQELDIIAKDILQSKVSDKNENLK